MWKYYVKYWVQKVSECKYRCKWRSHICTKRNQSFRTNRGLNQHLRSCYLKNKITDVQIAYEKMKTRQTITRLVTQILRFLVFQLHRCNINGAIIKIICLREIYLLLTKKQCTGRKIYFYYHLDKQGRVSQMKFPD